MVSDVVQQGVYDAFEEAGCALEVFDYFKKYHQTKNIQTTRQSLINIAKRFKPHLIHLQIQHTSIIDYKTIQRLKAENPRTIVTNWTGDVRNYVPPTYKKISEVADFNLISSTGQISMFENSLGKRVNYWQIGFNPKLYFPKNKGGQFKHDCVFIGHHNSRENYPGAAQRLKACTLLRRAFNDRFLLHGSHWPKSLRSRGALDQRKVNEAYSNSLCNISISHYNDLENYFSDRLLMCMASGRPTIALKFPGWQSFFADMGDIVIARSIDEIPNKVRMLVDNPDLANYIGQNGAAKVMAEHTYYSRIIELLEMVNLR